MLKKVDQTSLRVPVRRIGDHSRKGESDAVAIEEPLEIRLECMADGAYVERPVAITMRTPGDDFNLARGFLFSEGIIRSAGDIESIDYCDETVPGKSYQNSVRLVLNPAHDVRLKRLERNFYTTSSCGVCGKASLEALQAESIYDIDGDELVVGSDVLHRLPGALENKQGVFSRTGSLHAAGLFDRNGILSAVCEDVGRHNAVDKLIGASLQGGSLPLSNRGLLVSGRASFELMQKARMAGCPMLAAVGAPSSLAVELAWEFDMTLIGFLRDGRFNIYAGHSRVE